MSRWTATRIRASKGELPIVCVTAYDFSMARIVDGVGFHLILVGDSLGMTVLGYENTLPVTMEEMLHHTAAVARGVSTALVVADMPFMSYHSSISDALDNAGRFIKEAGADAVKVEGGTIRAKTISTLTGNGIPVLGHIGLTPQSLLAMGGYKIQGRMPAQAKRLLADAAALDAAGVFAIVLECIPSVLARDITAAVSVPTIGIGAGPDCDGQILVLHDVLGLHGKSAPKLKFVKQYASLAKVAEDALLNFKQDVERGVFPSAEHSFQ